MKKILFNCAAASTVSAMVLGIVSILLITDAVQASQAAAIGAIFVAGAIGLFVIGLGYPKENK